MGNIKTAISIQEDLFDKAEALARQLHISRSRLYAQALKDYIQKHQNAQLLEQINAAYDDQFDPEEEREFRSMRRIHRQILERDE